jgi:hypothetical protein
MANWLKQNLELPSKYNVKNSMTCAQKVKELDNQAIHRMLTDITNLYTNMPKNEVIDLIRMKLKEGPQWNATV